MDVVYEGFVNEDGSRWSPVNRAGFFRQVKAFAGQHVDLIIRKHRRQRSDRQNKYYWSTVVGILAEHCGYEREEMHEALKWKFLRLEDPDHPLPTVRSTTDLTTMEFEEYCERVRTFASVELRCYIPLLNEVDL